MKTIIGVSKKTGDGVFIDVVGLEDLDAILKNIPEMAKEAARKELKISLADLKGKSQRLCPVNKDPLAREHGLEPGALQASAFYETGWNGNNLEGTVGFQKEYALRQHEELDYQHDTGQAKYLEEPFKANVGQYTNNIADAIKKAMP